MCRGKKAGADLQISALGFEPILDVAFGISGKAEHEISLNLQLIDGLDGLMDLWIIQNQTENSKVYLQSYSSP